MFCRSKRAVKEYLEPNKMFDDAYLHRLQEVGSKVFLALTQENLSSVVCEQQRRRPACASVQSDQRICLSLIGKYNIITCYKRKFTILDRIKRKHIHFYG